MNYMGGKFRQGKAIATTIKPHLSSEITYVEPFCGAMGSAFRVVPEAISRGVKKIILNDNNEALMNMWQALLEGWNPPDVVSEDTYRFHKKTNDLKDPMTAYCGAGMSFGGKWWGGYAREEKHGERPYTNLKRSANLKRTVLLKTSTLLKAKESAEVVLCCLDYQELRGSNRVFYLDPPYANRAKVYKSTINHDHFWNYARDLVNSGNTVFITEFAAPDDFVPVHVFGDTVVRHHHGKGKDGTSEAIYTHISQAGNK